MSPWSLLIAVSPLLVLVLVLGVVSVIGVVRARRVDVPRVVEALTAALVSVARSTRQNGASIDEAADTADSREAS